MSCSRERVLEIVVVGDSSLLSHRAGLHQLLLMRPHSQLADIHTPVQRIVGVPSQPHQGNLLQGSDGGSLRPKGPTRRTTPSIRTPPDSERSSETEPPPIRRVCSVICIMNSGNFCVPGAYSPGQGWLSPPHDRRFRYPRWDTIYKGRLCTTDWNRYECM